jgi:hypothetical protein
MAKSYYATSRRKKQKQTKSPEHPGFQAIQSEIAARQGVSEERAGAILASQTRKASPAAKKRNPRLKRVKMPKKRRKGRK